MILTVWSLAVHSDRLISFLFVFFHITLHLCALLCTKTHISGWEHCLSLSLSFFYTYSWLCRTTRTRGESARKNQKLVGFTSRTFFPLFILGSIWIPTYYGFSLFFVLKSQRFCFSFFFCLYPIGTGRVYIAHLGFSSPFSFSLYGHVRGGQAFLTHRFRWVS